MESRGFAMRAFYEDFRDLSRFAVEIVNLGGGGKGGKDGD